MSENAGPDAARLPAIAAPKAAMRQSLLELKPPFKLFPCYPTKTSRRLADAKKPALFLETVRRAPPLKHLSLGTSRRNFKSAGDRVPQLRQTAGEVNETRR